MDTLSTIRMNSLEIARSILGEGSKNTTRLFELSRKIENYVHDGELPGTKTSFFEKFLIKTLTSEQPFSLYPHQEMMINALNHSDRLLIHQSRQMGVTTLLAAYAARFAIESENKRTALLTSNRELSLCYLNNIRNGVKNISPPVVSNKMSMSFSSGSEIRAATCNDQSFRGRTIDLLIIDVATSISHTVLYDAWVALQPCLTVDSKVVLAGVPTVPGGLFYDLWTDQSNGFNRLTLPWYISENDSARKMEAVIGKEQFAIEYNCKLPI